MFIDELTKLTLERCLKGTAHGKSDIDLLVEFEPGHTPGLIALASMELELSGMLDGRKIDLRTPSDLSRHFRDDVVRSARVEYAACRSHPPATHARSAFVLLAPLDLSHRTRAFDERVVSERPLDGIGGVREDTLHPLVEEQAGQ